MRWITHEKISESTLKQFPDIHPLALQLLWNRNVRTQEAIERFLTPDYKSGSYDPFLFSDMRKAVNRVFAAKEKNEKVVIYADYDADGVCGGAVLYESLKKIGITAHVHLPHREKEGYGLNMGAVQEFIKRGVQLVITCDCGITSKKEISALAKKNIDAIITDHHLEPKEMPKAFAVLNPSLAAEPYPFKGLIGTGVAFKLAQALFMEGRSRGMDIKEGEEKWLLDLVAAATIGDWGPLIDENRTLVTFGLVVLKKTRRPGFLGLQEYSRIQLSSIDETYVSYKLVPRLNAASRMDHANTAFELLIEQDPKKSFLLAAELERLNTSRQKASDSMFQECKKQIGTAPKDFLLVALGNNWSAGLVGLVAGRMLGTYNRPSLVIGDNGEEIVGSGRSLAGINITKMLEECSEYLEKFGGHPQACGFTVKRKHLNAFVKKMKRLCKAEEGKKRDEESLSIDAEIPFEKVTWELWEQLQHFSPYGEGNSRPILVSRDVVVDAVRTVGAGGKHLQVHVRRSGETMQKTIAFGFAPQWKDELPQGTKIDIAFELSVNEWNGTRELQVKIIDIKKA